MDAYAVTPLTDAERVLLAVVRRFPRDQWQNAMNIAQLENPDCDPGAINDNNEHSIGIFQINIAPNANPKYASYDLEDIEVNVQVAAEIYQSWGNWGAWYNSATQLGLI